MSVLRFGIVSFSVVVDIWPVNHASCHLTFHCLRRILPKHKEKKDWNKKQSGGHLRKSPYYLEFDEILGCRDFVTFNNVKESALIFRPSAGCSSLSSPFSPPVLAEDSNCDSEKSSEEAKNEWKHRQKREKQSSRSQKAGRCGCSDPSVGHMKDQGDQLTFTLTELQKSNVAQTKMMSQFMGATLKALKTFKDQCQCHCTFSSSTSSITVQTFWWMIIAFNKSSLHLAHMNWRLFLKLFYRGIYLCLISDNARLWISLCSVQNVFWIMSVWNKIRNLSKHCSSTNQQTNHRGVAPVPRGTGATL